MRNHAKKYECMEVGENPLQCAFGLESLIGPAIGAAVGLFGAEDQNEAQLDYARQVNQPQLWPQIQPYVNQILADAQNLYAQQGFAPQPNELQMLGLQNYLGYAEGALPGMVEAAQASWLDALNPEVSQYVRDQIALGQGELAETFQEQTMPYISSSAQGAGGYGGSRQGVAEGLAAEGLSEAQAQLETNLMADAYRAELASQASALGMAPQMAGLGYMPAQGQMDVGAAYQQQAGLPAANLQGYAQMINPYAQYSTGAGAGQYQNPYSSALAGAGLGYGIGQQVWGSQGAGQVPGDAYLPGALWGSGASLWDTGNNYFGWW